MGESHSLEDDCSTQLVLSLGGGLIGISKECQAKLNRTSMRTASNLIVAK